MIVETKKQNIFLSQFDSHKRLDFAGKSYILRLNGL